VVAAATTALSCPYRFRGDTGTNKKTMCDLVLAAASQRLTPRAPRPVAEKSKTGEIPPVSSKPSWPTRSFRVFRHRDHPRPGLRGDVKKSGK
jgi:hypothetical protein